MHENGIRSIRLNGTGDLLSGLLIPAADNDLRSLLAADFCHGTSDTLGTTGDHDDFLF